MNYYKRHIGDYAAKAGHLSPLEHGVYTLILDAYYNREQGPTEAEAIRWARARNPDETQAVSNVLHDFFILTDGRYVQPRVEEELQAAQARADHNRAVGKLGGRPPRARKTRKVSDGLQPGSKNNPNPLIHKSTIEAPPKGGRSPKLDLQAFLAECEATGEKPIPADDAVFAYAQRIGLPAEYVALAWAWFKTRYAGKTQTGVRGWRQAFRNAVEGNWPKLWYADDAGGWALTTAGKQAQRAQS